MKHKPTKLKKNIAINTLPPIKINLNDFPPYLINTHAPILNTLRTQENDMVILNFEALLQKAGILDCNEIFNHVKTLFYYHQKQLDIDNAMQGEDAADTEPYDESTQELPGSADSQMQEIKAAPVITEENSPQETLLSDGPIHLPALSDIESLISSTAKTMLGSMSLDEKIEFYKTSVTETKTLFPYGALNTQIRASIMADISDILDQLSDRFSYDSTGKDYIRDQEKITAVLQSILDRLSPLGTYASDILNSHFNDGKPYLERIIECISHRSKTVEILHKHVINCLQLGANPNVKNKETGHTTLHVFMNNMSGYKEFLKQAITIDFFDTLLNYGASPSLPDNSGYTPVFLAKSYRTHYLKMTEKYGGQDQLKRAEKIRDSLAGHADEIQPLFTGIRNGDIGFLSFLCKTRALSYAKDPLTGKTALHSIAESKMLSNIPIRINKNGKVFYSDAGATRKEHTWVQLSQSVAKAPEQAKRRKDGQITITLIDFLFFKIKADPNYQDARGNTALMWAVIGGNINAIATLIEAGADPLLPNDMGLTPIHIAASQTDNTLDLLSSIFEGKKDLWQAICSRFKGINGTLPQHVAAHFNGPHSQQVKSTEITLNEGDNATDRTGALPTNFAQKIQDAFTRTDTQPLRGNPHPIERRISETARLWRETSVANIEERPTHTRTDGRIAALKTRIQKATRGRYT